MSVVPDHRVPRRTQVPGFRAACNLRQLRMMRHLAAPVAVEKRALARRVLDALPEQLVAAEVQRPRTEQPFLEDPGARQQVEVLALGVALARAGTGPVREVTTHRDGVRGSIAVGYGEVPGAVFSTCGG